MRTFLIILSLFLLSVNSFSQNGWVQVNSGTTKSLNKAFFINNNTGWVCGDSGLVIKTTNKGFTWTTSPTNTNQLLKDIFFINENTGWAVGGRFINFSSPENKQFIIRTDNGGASWYIQLEFSDWDNVLTCVHFYDANTGIVLGAGSNGGALTGIFRKTTNGGLNWSYFPTFSTGAIKVDKNGSIWRIASRWVDFGGMDSSYVFYSTNRGESWQTKLAAHRIVFRDIDLINNSTPVVLSDSGSQRFFLKSSDSGGNWYKTELTFAGFQSYIEFSNENTGWCGRTQLYYTTNAGANWNVQLNPEPNFIQRVQMFDAVNGICLAGGGKIYITGTGGLTSVNPVSNSVPENFYLSQNYPNPFNPSTIINYQLAINSNVSIKIYDALGNEIETLVNEKQNAGSYSVDFNAAQLPSGIYFYKLITEKFSETKKMILIK